MRDGAEQPVDVARAQPSVVARLDGVDVAVALRQVTSTGSGPCHPKQRVEELTTVGAGPAFALATARHQLLKPFPLAVRQILIVHERPLAGALTIHAMRLI